MSQLDLLLPYSRPIQEFPVDHLGRRVRLAQYIRYTLSRLDFLDIPEDLEDQQDPVAQFQVIRWVP